MATLKKHGGEIGRIDYLTYKLAFFENGTVLRNFGTGWKVYGSIKAGLTPLEGFNNRLETSKNAHKKNPLYHEYFLELHNLPVKFWFMVNNAIKELCNDPEGLFSSFDDFSYSSSYPKLTLNDCKILCQKYNLYMSEKNDKY